MNLTQVANSSVSFLIDYFGMDTLTARIVVQGFVPYLMDWSPVAHVEILGGGRMSFPRFLSGVLVLCLLMNASACTLEFETMEMNENAKRICRFELQSTYKKRDLSDRKQDIA